MHRCTTSADTQAQTQTQIKLSMPASVRQWAQLLRRDEATFYSYSTVSVAFCLTATSFRPARINSYLCSRSSLSLPPPVIYSSVVAS